MPKLGNNSEGRKTDMRMSFLNRESKASDKCKGGLRSRSVARRWTAGGAELIRGVAEPVSGTQAGERLHSPEQARPAPLPAWMVHPVPLYLLAALRAPSARPAGELGFKAPPRGTFSPGASPVGAVGSLWWGHSLCLLSSLGDFLSHLAAVLGPSGVTRVAVGQTARVCSV